MLRVPLRALPLFVCCAVALTACGGGSIGSAAASSPGKLQVVAAENFWGSIAAQLGGSKVAVQSIIVNPNTDPHSYEPTASDGVALAKSQVAIVNGIGYDAWASKLIAANPSSSRKALNVGDLLGLVEGDNPHQWYSPSSLQRVIDQIVVDYKQLDPKDSAYFDRQRSTFETHGLAGYNKMIADDPRPLRWGAGRLQREHLPAARCGARSEVADAIQLREGDRRGDRRERGRQADGRRPSAEPSDQGVGLQQSERDPGCAARQSARPGSAHPDHDDHRNALTGLGYLRAMAGRGTPGPPAGPPPGDRADEPLPRSSMRRPCPTGRRGRRHSAVPVVALRGAQARIGGKTVWSDVDFAIADGRVRRDPRTQRFGKDDAAAGAARRTAARRR